MVVASGGDVVGGTVVLVSRVGEVDTGTLLVVLLRLGVVEAELGAAQLKLRLRLPAWMLEEVVEVLAPLVLLLRPEVPLVLEAPPLMPLVMEGTATPPGTPLLELEEDVHSNTTS